MIRSTMQDFPLTITSSCARSERLRRQRVRDVDRRRRPARDLRRGRRPRRAARRRAAALGIARRATASARSVEQPGAPRGVPRGPVHGRGAAHAQHPALPRAARLRRQPRRGPGRHRRRLARAAAREGRRPSSRPSSTSIVVGDGDASALGAGRPVLRYEELLAAEQPGFDWPELDETRRRGDVLHERHHRQPEGRRLLPPLDVPALARGVHPGRLGLDRARPHPRDRADVPRQRVGPAVRRVACRRATS